MTNTTHTYFNEVLNTLTFSVINSQYIKIYYILKFIYRLFQVIEYLHVKTNKVGVGISKCKDPTNFSKNLEE